MRRAWSRCRGNLKANFLAGLLIWTIGVIVYLGNENWVPCKNLLNEIGNAKKHYGYLYSAVSTSFFGGLIPFLVLWARKRVPSSSFFKLLAFFLGFWAYKGVEVDAFYRLQSICFGESSNFQVVLTKVLADQFVYCVIWSAPITAIFYGWKDTEFSWSNMVLLKNASAMIDETLFLLVSTWIVWTPAVSIIYSMPENLQIPLFNLTLCFFVMVITITEKPEEKAVAG